MSMICQSVVLVGFVYFYELACLKLNAQTLEQIQVYLLVKSNHFLFINLSTCDGTEAQEHKNKDADIVV